MPPVETRLRDLCHLTLVLLSCSLIALLSVLYRAFVLFGIINTTIYRICQHHECCVQIVRNTHLSI